MSKNLLEITKKITEKYPEWKMLCRKLKINGEVVENRNFSLGQSSSYNYKNLELIERFNRKIIWTEVSAVGRECSIELQNRAEFDMDGNFVRGTMNTFYVGFQNMDTLAARELLSQVKSQFSKINYWDVISNKIDSSILQGFGINSNEENETDHDYHEKDDILINLFKSYKKRDFHSTRELVFEYFDGINFVDVKALVDGVPTDIKYQVSIMWMRILDEIGVNLKTTDPIIRYFAMLNYDYTKSMDASAFGENLSKRALKKLSKIVCPICKKKITTCKCLSS